MVYNTSKRCLCWQAFALAAWLFGGAAQAQAPEDAAASAAEDRATTFRAVSGAPKEQVAGGPLLLGAYALVWLLTCAYLWRLGRMQGRLETELQQLQRQLETVTSLPKT